MELKGKHISVLGAGSSGRAAAKLAVAHGASVHLYDSNEILHTENLPEGISVHPKTTEDLAKMLESDLVIISPGIDTFGSFVKAFSEKAHEVIGEVEFACRFYKGKIIAITGTNGKTTTTEIVDYLVKGAGKTCVPCGNYGLALSEVVNSENPPEVIALEVSSFQLESIKEFCPDVAIWLNFDADHMDRYKSLVDYRKAKLRIFENQCESRTAIVRLGEIVDTKAKTIYFSSEKEADYYLFGTEIKNKGETLIDLNQTKLRGLHNVENLMAAMAAVRTIGLKVNIQSILDFVPPRHRCELVATVKGVEYINDSKATNLHALDSALRSLPAPLILIAGGKDKGLNYSPLADRLRSCVKKAYVIGEIADQLIEEFPDETLAQKCASLEEAVQLASEAAKSGDTVLLSPGTSSFDFYTGYEQRGNAFVSAVENI
ncbi:UDP-N-acetylmuramoyl-L-alanine--D-glutamate ligase [Akkermansiaceae bacterium]|nr:UDP-N-acetylmuramoyl-L-alanine--D-glutamate ligase [Akkermansiaceae bacterium]